MLNLLLFPFRLVAWFWVQLKRVLSSFIVHPLRLLFWVFKILTSRIVAIPAVFAFGLFALRLSTPRPVDEWFTTQIRYPSEQYVSDWTLLGHTLFYRETSAPDLRLSQFYIAIIIVILFLVLRFTRRKQEKIREGLANSAAHLKQLRPNPLVPPRSDKPVAEKPAKAPKASKPTKPKPLVHARYGLGSLAVNDDLEQVIERLPPELQGFIETEQK